MEVDEQKACCKKLMLGFCEQLAVVRKEAKVRWRQQYFKRKDVISMEEPDPKKYKTYAAATSQPQCRRFDGSQFYLNRLPHSGPPNSLTFPQILEKEHLRRAILSTYTFEAGWFFEQVEPTTRVTIVKHWDAKTEKAGHFVVNPNVTCIHPPNPIQCSSMNAKWLILLYENFVRVVITSANLTEREYYGVIQRHWIQDFRRKSQGHAGDTEEELETPKADDGFQLQLHRILSSIYLDPTFLDEYDFSDAKVEIVYSIPTTHQAHVGGQMYQCGILDIRPIASPSSDDVCMAERPMKKKKKNDPTQTG